MYVKIMKEKIKKYLSDIEKEKNIKILLACETGSRAWGFPSPDSDYDIRIIYVHKKDWYLSLTEEKDTIELMLENNEIDITGWDLRKSLRLLVKSNPPLLERVQSPIIYTCDEGFLKGINELAKNAYSRRATIHHYLSMAKKSYDLIVDKEEYKLKKFFYALRASVATMWILEREEIPPIVFQQMLDGLNIREGLVSRIKQLIELKATLGETYLHKGEHELIEFMQVCLQRAERDSGILPVSKPSMEGLNSFFRKMVVD